MRKWVKHVHFVGIGGVGMSGIASVLLKLGYRVSGSDIAHSTTTERLREAGAEVQVGHDAAHVAGCDVVVVSSAIPFSNPEVRAAAAARVPVIPRAEMLGELMRFSQGIAVAGTHGKTTTTSLIAKVLAGGGLDPTYIMGGVLMQAEGSGRLGRGDYLVAEADESDASFLHLQPLVAVVTNIDADHMMTYGGDFGGLRQAFIEFLHNLPFYGLVVLCVDDPVVREMIPSVRKPVMTYGVSGDANVRAVAIRQDAERMSFDVVFPGGGKPLPVTLALPGHHNVLNALAALCVGHQLGVAFPRMREALASFEGINRRFQLRGELPCNDGTFLLVDDYAHHPRELAATLAAAAGGWPRRRRVVVFQPHRYSRVRDLLDELADALKDCEPLFVTEVYPAGEKAIAGADGAALCDAIRARGGTPLFVHHPDALPGMLHGVLRHDDMLLLLGAGDISEVAGRIAEHGIRSPAEAEAEAAPRGPAPRSAS